MYHTSVSLCQIHYAAINVGCRIAVLFAPAMGRQPGGNNRGLCHDCKKLDLSSPCLLPKEGDLTEPLRFGGTT